MKELIKNQIRIFQDDTFGQIRVVLDKSNKPLFCLADVCNALGLKSHHVRERLDDDIVSTDTIVDSIGRQQIANFINEDGLYDVILDSRKPEAKRFRKWITGEVLPSIREHGVYMTGEAIERALSDPDQIIALATKWKNERQKRLEVEAQNQRLAEDNQYKKEVIEGLVRDIPVADMRQRVNQIVTKAGAGDFGGAWRMLFDEFDRKYHINVRLRIQNAGFIGNTVDYIDKELNMIPELYDLACKLFESSYEQLMESWGKYAKRAKIKRHS